MYYREGIEHARRNLPASVLLGFNTNVDAVKHLKGAELEGLELPETIADLPDHMATGTQKEVAVGEEVLDFLINNFGVDEYRIGGQVGNMARDAARLGVISFAHVAKKCRQQMQLLDQAGIRIAGPGGFVSPGEITEECTPAVHYVMEFKRGDTIGGKEIPASNRYIASYDPENSRMELDPLFLEYMDQEIGGIKKGVVSGFHLLEEGYSHRVEDIGAIIEGWKEKNPDLFLHLEMAEFQSRKILEKVQKHILPKVDSVGANEIELAMMTGIEDRDEALAEVAKEVFYVLYHSSAYSACIADAPKEDMQGVLQFAALTGAYKAAHGRGPTMEELEAYRPERPSRKGMEAKKELEAVDFGKDVVVVPSLVVQHPRSLVGVGDCFTVSFVLAI
jgi:ADP-dependent phosphofructokinase/glucokinase